MVTSMSSGTSRQVSSGSSSALAIAAGYFVAGKLGLQLAFVHSSATAVWPPTGIGLAACLACQASGTRSSRGPSSRCLAGAAKKLQRLFAKADAAICCLSETRIDV